MAQIINILHKTNLCNQFNPSLSAIKTIDVSSLQKGTYLIGFGKKQTTKFIVK